MVDTWAALTRPRPHRPALTEQQALAVLRQQAGQGLLPKKLVDALEPVVLSSRAAPPVHGRFEQGGGPGRAGDPGSAGDPGDPEEPDPSLRLERPLTAARPAALPALSL
jgi:hypothetical protein